MIGVNPNYRVFLFAGEVKDGSFKQGLSPAVLGGEPQDGYLVRKVKSGLAIALSTVVATRTGAAAGSVYNACGGQRVPVIEVPRGKVVYLGDIEYSPGGSQILVRYHDRPARAAAHLRTHYPQVRADVQPVDFRLLPIANACPSKDPITFPIYVPRR